MSRRPFFQQTRETSVEGLETEVKTPWQIWQRFFLIFAIPIITIFVTSWLWQGYNSGWGPHAWTDYPAYYSTFRVFWLNLSAGLTAFGLAIAKGWIWLVTVLAVLPALPTLPTAFRWFMALVNPAYPAGYKLRDFDGDLIQHKPAQKDRDERTTKEKVAELFSALLEDDS